ncbi:hypothetical protein N9N06_01390 [Aquiluna sp.]|nr:hypothetical protein [Aquiluna sp.]
MNKLPKPSTLLESATVFNWRTHVVFAVPAYLTAALFESERYGGDPLAWFWVASVGLAVTATVIEVLARGFRKRADRRWPVALGILGLAGVIRGTTILILGNSLGLFSLDQSEIFYRLLGGPIFVLTAYSTINAAIESYLAFRRDINSLEEDRQELGRLRSGYRAEVDAATQRQRDRVNQLLAPAMWELQKLFQKAPSQVDLQQALIRLESITNDIVRPVSHELANTSLLEVSERKLSANRNRLTFPLSVTPRGTFSLWFFAVAFFTGSTNAQLSSANSLTGVLTVFVTAMPMAAFLAVLLGPLRNRSFHPTTFALVLGLAGVGLGALGGFASVTLGLAATEALIWQASSYFFLALQITYAYGLLSVGWSQTLRELEETIGELELMNARLRQQIWLRQKSLALELHGSVQSRLTALAKTIEKMDPGDSDRVTQLIVDIRESLGRVEDSDYLDGRSFDDLVCDLRLLWEGTVEIELEHSKQASGLLEEDDGLARCVFEILREAVTNSVKHGSADQISVKTNLTQAGIAIEIWNNGSRVEAGSRYERSKLLDQLCASHDLQNVKNGVLLRAEVTSTLEPSL